MNKLKAIAFLILVIIGVAALLGGGCVQIISEKGYLKINTLLTTSGIESMYSDPNQFQVNEYRSIPADAEVVFDPLTKTFRVKVKGVVEGVRGL